MAADRFVLKQFAGSATNNGAFGAAQATGAGVQPVSDIKQVQSLNAFEQGWNAATLTADKLPALEEMQGLEALLCKALKENYSEGIPFWISGETYFQYSFVNYNGVLYYNTTGSYTNNNPAIDTANWAAYNKVGTATVGTDDTPIYLNVGTPTAGKRMGVVAYDNTKTYNLDDVVLNVDSSGAVELYLSLAASNTSALTDTTKWKKVSLGGGGDIGDMGFAPLGIDESLNLRRYLNGQLISQDLSPSFTNKVKAAIALHPSLGTTEASWQSEKTASKLGQVGKFVVDDVNNTIRLPAIVNVQGLMSLSGIGNVVNESLPNITGKITGTVSGGLVSSNYSTEGALSVEYSSGTYTFNEGSANQRPKSFNIDASLSSSTYQTDAPVQQEAVQYPYYIQVATGIEETLPAIREYGINTPFFFGQSMYSENAPYNASWLASNGTYNSGSVYPDMYTQLNNVELNGSLNVGDTIEIDGKTYVKRGLPVVLSTGTITDYDFVVNQNDQTFRLPLLNGEESLVSNKYDELTITQSTEYTAPANGWFCINGMDTSGTVTDSRYVIRKNNTRYYGIAGYTTGSSSAWIGGIIPVSKGDEVSLYFNATAISSSNTKLRFYYAQGNGTLYYYVGDTVQDASLINAGAVFSELARIEAMYANKADINLSNVNNTGNVAASNLNSKGIRTVVETYKSGASWYRVWSDGWIEQGGYVATSGSNQGTWSATLNLIRQMTTNNYTMTYGVKGGVIGAITINISSQTTTKFSVNLGRIYDSNGIAGFYWYACGY